MKTLYLHIGTPKTATSAIQNFCCQNSDLLNQKGYCYPIFPYIYPRKSQKRNASFLYAPIFKGGVRQSELEIERVKEGMKTILNLFKKYDNIILSDEDIWRNGYEKKKTLWNDLNTFSQQHHFCLKIIVYLRRQDTLIESWWNQRLKGPYYDKSYSWEDYLHLMDGDPRFDYYDILEYISSAVGFENIIVRRFDRKYFPNDKIEYDFLKCLNLEPTEEYMISDDLINTRLCGNTPEIQLILNSLPSMTKDFHQYFLDILRPCSEISGELYPNNMFSIDEAKAFMEKYAEGNQKVAEKYFHEENGELFDMTFRDLPKWEKDNPYMLDDIIRFTGATAMRQLKDFQSLHQQVEQLTKRIDNLTHSLRHPVRSVFRHTFKS